MHLFMYTVSPESIRVLRGKDPEFNNVTIRQPEGCNIMYDDGQYEYMTCSGNLVLGDRSIVPHPPELSNDSYFEHFVVFKRNQYETRMGSQFVQFDIQTPRPTITAIELSFLNSPANRISLPDITLSNDHSTIPGPNTNHHIPIISKVLNNQDLSHTDHCIRTVAIQPITSLDNMVNIRLTFTFDIVHDFDWLFLSEVQFCTDSQEDFNSQREVEFQTPLVSPSTVHPSADDLRRGSIELECSVSSEGQYEWTWKRDNSVISKYDDGYQITVGDGSRTTKLTINNLNFNNAATYRCNATNSHSAMYVLAYPGKL